MMEKLVIDVTTEDRHRIETLAHQHGYPSVGEYILSLIAADADDDVQTKEELLEELQQGMEAAIAGKTIPASELWDALHRDE